MALQPALDLATAPRESMLTLWFGPAFPEAHMFMSARLDTLRSWTHWRLPKQNYYTLHSLFLYPGILVPTQQHPMLPLGPSSSLPGSPP